jgi:hypothetical protein
MSGMAPSRSPAGAGGRDLTDVYAWLNDPALTAPIDLLRAAGHTAAASALLGRVHGAPETRDGVYETARTATQRPARRRHSRLGHPTSIATSRQSASMLSRDGAGAAAPLVAALTDRILRHAVRAAEARGGRLDPPLVLVLDEAANVCRIADLPDPYSHLGSRGITP